MKVTILQLLHGAVGAVFSLIICRIYWGIRYRINHQIW